MNRKRYGRNITSPLNFFSFPLTTLSVVPFTARLIEPGFIAAAIMSVINVLLSCPRFAAFSHKELPGVLYGRQLVTRNVSGVAIANIYERICKKHVLSTFSAGRALPLSFRVRNYFPRILFPNAN